MRSTSFSLENNMFQRGFYRKYYVLHDFLSKIRLSRRFSVDNITFLKVFYRNCVIPLLKIISSTILSIENSTSHKIFYRIFLVPLYKISCSTIFLKEKLGSTGFPTEKLSSLLLSICSTQFFFEMYTFHRSVLGYLHVPQDFPYKTLRSTKFFL